MRGTRGVVLAQLRCRPGRSLAYGMGILVAAVSFILLTSEATTNRVAVQGTVRHNFRPAYDMVIRPEGSVNGFERRHQVVEDGFLSGIYGGLTVAQWHAIQHLQGVQVAAPVANVGYFMLSGTVYVSLPPKDQGPHSSQAVYRFSSSWIVHHGLERYPDSTSYLYATTNPLILPTGHYYPEEVVPGTSSPVPVCRGFLSGIPRSSSPYDVAARTGFYCTSTTEHFAKGTVAADATAPGQLSVEIPFEIPVLVSGIDPTAENQLLHLSHAVVSGRYLQEGEGLSAPVSLGPSGPGSPYTREVPIVASTKTFLDQVAQVQVLRLRVPRGANLSAKLASPGGYRFVTQLSGQAVDRVTIAPTAVYGAFLSLLGHRPDFAGTKGATTFASASPSGSYWTVGAAHYQVAGAHSLRAETVPNQPAVWFEQTATPNQGGSLAPAGAQGTWFRPLTIKSGSGSVLPTGRKGPTHGHPVFASPLLKVVGRFDPGRLPGFSTLSRVPLSTYFPPQVSAGSLAASKALGNNPLGPTTNLGGYVSQPPLFLTTMKGVKALENPKAFAGANPDGPISAVRVRVAGVSGPNAVSLARVRLVAQEIHQQLGLPVQITVGSSPTTEGIILAKGCCGRPPLVVKQGWSKEGVAITILDALDYKDLAIFALVLVVCGLFLANGTLASVRGRRLEIAILRTLGWPGRAVFSLVLGEVALVGLGAGVVGTVIALGLVEELSLSVRALEVGLVVPVASMLAFLSGLVPASRAARIGPLEAMAPALSTRMARRRARSVLGLGLSNMARIPARAGLEAAGLAVGVGSLALLLGLELAFRGQVAGNLLGDVVTLQVRAVDLASAILAVGLGAASVADVSYLSLRERSAELATLRALGWRERDVVGLVAVEGLSTGVIGALTGAMAGVAVVGLLGGAVVPVAVTAVIGSVVGVVLVGVALAVPLFSMSRSLPTSALAGE